jgi:predicted DNA-binding protein
MATALPPTTAFPADPAGLDRGELEEYYISLRGYYKGLMISRGQHRSIAQKRGAAMQELEQRLRSLAEREATVRKEAYEMLEIVTTVVGELEDAGDDLQNEFTNYQHSRRNYAGGSFIGGLIRAVIRFLNRWSRSKEQFEQLALKQQTMKGTLNPEPAAGEQEDGKDR